MARLTTICYIEKDNKYLMLHRTKKKNDMSEGKYLGIGGKFEDGESPEECILREVKEETGLTLTKYKQRGIMTFTSDKYETEYMHIFTATEYEGTISECNEGDLEWIDIDKVNALPIWEGDKLFFDLLKENIPFFGIKVHYSKDNELLDYSVQRY